MRQQQDEPGRFSICSRQAAVVHLSGLGGYLKILSASADNLEIFESIYHEGMEPDDWVPEYLERAI
ncbi:TPA: hypothetical protein ACH9LV_005190 [Escherichia coli]